MAVASKPALEEIFARLGFDIREITRVHSSLIWVLAALLAWGLWTAREGGSFHRDRLTRLITLGAAQGAIGYLQYFTGVPVLLALCIMLRIVSNCSLADWAVRRLSQSSGYR